MIQDAAKQETTQTAARQPRYLLAIVVGLLAAVIVSPIHRWAISGTFANGYYVDYPIIVVGIGLVVGFAMRVAAGSGEGNVILGILAGLVTLIGVVISEYLVVHYLINQYRLEDGLSTIPLLLWPDAVLLTMIDYLLAEPVELILWVTSVGIAVAINVVKDFGAGARWSPAASQRRVDLFGEKRTASPPPTAFDSPQHGIAAPPEAYGLGSPIREYGVALGRTGLLAGIFGALMIGIFALGFIVEDMPVVVTAMFGLIFLGLTLFRLVILLLNLNNRIVIFDDGISIAQQGKTHTFRWDEIDKVYHQQQKYQQGLIPMLVIHNYRLVHRNGDEVTIRRWYERLDELGSTIHEAVTRHQLPRAMEALRRGEELDFETMRVGREGIYSGKKRNLIPWSDVKNVTVWQGTVRIGRKSKPLASVALAMAKTPNLHLFFSLSDKALSGSE